MRLASSCSIFIVVLISEIDNVFEWSDSENSSNYHPNLDDYVQKPTCVDESRLVEKPPYLTPYYSSSLHILRIYALRVTEIFPGVTIHKICCVSSEIFNLELPQLPGEAVSSDKLCFS